MTLIGPAKEDLEIFQSKIQESKNGTCFSCRLVNYYEVKFIDKNKQSIIFDLDQIIEKLCIDFLLTSCYKKINKDRILFIIKTQNSELTRKFAQKLYLSTQLYINEACPAIYMNCYIASVMFPQISDKAEEIEDILDMLLSSKAIECYYREYNNSAYNLENIIKSNIQLNLLRYALAKKTMKFAYQPIVDRTTLKIRYYECLLRIPDKDNNYISVGPIIPIAENTGLIFVIDQIVLEMAIKELVENHELTLAVNISNVGTTDEALWEIAEHLLQTYNVSDRLIIEITETSFNENYEKTTLFINKLRKFGCKFALDDFGSGFTSFKQLQSLPIDIIKIDGKYVRGITNDVQCQYFIKRIVQMSEDLKIDTVAEFVENNETAKLLIDLKIGGLQGNFYSEALFNKVEVIKPNQINK